MNEYDQLIRKIIETTPSWEKDGGGVRGRTLAPILSGSSVAGPIDTIPQIFSQQNNETIQRVAGEPVSDLILGGGTGGAPAATLPWDLLPTNVGTPQNPSWEVRVQAGTVNYILPSNWDSVWTLPNSGVFYAKAIVVTDGISVSGVTIEINQTQPTQQTPRKYQIPTRVEYLFGLFSGGQKYRVIGPNSIFVFSRTWLVTSTSPPAAAGEIPYDIYYILQ